MQTWQWIPEALAALDREHLRRKLSLREGPQAARIVLDGQELINFGSNDYLGLAADRRLANAVIEALEQEGWGSGASPLVCGHALHHQRLEKKLAEFEALPAVLLFTSGFAANAGVIAALVGPGDVVFCDDKNHASLWDGCRLSRADVRTYPHGDCNRLKKLLEKAVHYRRRLIVTDGLFSMDGDLAPLPEIVRLAERFEAMLLVDEAHATGVFGKHGRGAAEHLSVEHFPHVRIGTLSKALGGVGGFVAGEREVIEWIVNRARHYIFSTALPAAVAAASLAALDIICNEPWRREALLSRAKMVREALAAQGWNIGPAESQIIPLIVRQPDVALQLSGRLRQRGLFVPAVRPPAVPAGEARLRISLTAAHADEMLAKLITTLAELKPAHF